MVSLPPPELPPSMSMYANSADYWKAMYEFREKEANELSEEIIRLRALLAVEAARSAPKGEAVAWQVAAGFWQKYESIPAALRAEAIPLYTHPPVQEGPQRKTLPPNAGKPWDDEQNALIRTLFLMGRSAREIAEEMGRTRFGIEQRLIFLGLISQSGLVPPSEKERNSQC